MFVRSGFGGDDKKGGLERRTRSSEMETGRGNKEAISGRVHADKLICAGGVLSCLLVVLHSDSGFCFF